MKQLLFVFIFSFVTLSAYAQKVEFSGNIIDEDSSEPLIGATVKIGTTGTATDLDGNYKINIDKGDYEVIVSYVGYKPQTHNLSLQKAKEVYNFELQSNSILDEIVVVADLAKERETPVAYSNIPTAQIEEELGTQDLPMVLNSTPGVYATQQGGGDGDARVNIRGFNQRNIAVMIDGLPVNDMENGWVYWSNWSGLSDVTKSMQVQRGLGASKLAIPSIGGTINVITKGIESKKGITFKQSFGSGHYYKSALSLTTGRLKNGWAVTFNGALKYSDGYINNLYSKGASYFVKVDKELKKHLISFSIFGAPQSHAQRNFKSDIQFFDSEYAAEVGVDPEQINADPENIDRGVRDYAEYGCFHPYSINARNDTVWGKEKTIYPNSNFYHKPQITLKDYWNISKKAKWSNIAYFSVGKGGGSSFAKSLPRNDRKYRDAETGEIDFDKIVLEQNRFLTNSDGEYRSLQFIEASHNEHVWYGLLSTFSYTFDLGLKVNVGFDGRIYNGSHFKRVKNLLGGDFIEIPEVDVVALSKRNYREGEKFDRDNKGLVRWGGAFTQLEYSTEKLSTFLNLTGSLSANKRIDYYELKKDLVLSDTTILQAVGYQEPYIHNGVEYTIDSKESRFSETDWKFLPGFTVKMGANYNLNDHHNVFVNGGYYSKAPLFTNIFSFRNTVYPNIENEKIRALELGYGAKYSKWAINANIYYTNWLNKPLGGPLTISFADDPETSYESLIVDIDAVHAGIEIDGVYKITKKLSIEGLLSIGDWYWNSTESSPLYVGGILTDRTLDDIDFRGIHVGDAAQFQYGASLRYEPFKGFYAKLRTTYFSKNFSDFNPAALENIDDAGSNESWQIPNYQIFDFTTGYRTKFGKYPCSFNFNVNNLLNTLYISDASNGTEFNASTATVFMGLGRRWSASVKINL